MSCGPAAATSAPLTDDGFGQRLALDGDRLIVWIVVVYVKGWIGQAGDFFPPSSIFRPPSSSSGRMRRFNKETRNAGERKMALEHEALTEPIIGAATNFAKARWNRSE